jgi:REP element-mobilizing transposase RayT
MLNRFRKITEARCTGWGGKLVELNGEADHVHLLLELPPNLDLSVFVNNLKTTSISSTASIASRCCGPGPTASFRAAVRRFRF